MGVKEVRAVASGQLPFTLAKNYGRPSPVHVVNGYLWAALGRSSRSDAVRKLIRSTPGEVQELADRYDMPFLKESEWLRDREKIGRLQSDLRTVLDPDRRVFPTRGSLFPVNDSLVSNDTSDNGYGGILWEMVSHNGEKGHLARLEALLDPEEAQDCVTRLGQVLSADASKGTTRDSGVSSSSWFIATETPAAEVFVDSIVQFIQSLADSSEGPGRLIQLQRLTRGLYLSVVMSVLLEPIVANSAKDVNSLDQIAPMLIWAGRSPGPPDHRFVQASAQSFQALVQTNRRSLATLIKRRAEEKLEDAPVPKSDRRVAAVRALLAEGGRSSRKIDKVVSSLRENGLLGEGEIDEGWTTRILRTGYTEDFITRAVRSMGKKVGFIGPRRGAASPRFVCETPLLATLVAGVCSGGGPMVFQKFVDTVRERFGLVFGLGSDESVPVRAGVWEGTGIGRRLLKDNEERLKRRLIRAGLAREYSDGHTEVGYER